MNKNSFAAVPPMGWNSYDYYDTAVDEARVRANADYMSAHMRAFGWEYIVVDIQWYAHGAGSRRDEFQYIPFSRLEMDAYSRLMPDPERFPSSRNGKGFAPLADYVHGLGLKFGIHIMRGVPRVAAHNHTALMGSDKTAADIALPESICAWNPDMYGVRNDPDGQAYYDSLLRLYADWGVDFIKCDDICRLDQPSARAEIDMLALAIARCGRPIVLSLSPGPALISEAWHYEQCANMWRITDDFWDDFKLLKDMFRRCELWQTHVSEGCYPDCDMLPLGRLGKGFGSERATRFTPDEQRTMMTLWCLFGSPLMLGAELTMLDGDTLKLLTNREILGMLPPRFKPHQLRLRDDEAVWEAKCEQTGEHYIAFFNLSDAERIVSVSSDALGIRGAYGAIKLTELWTGAESVADGAEIQARTAPHGCAVYRVKVA